MTTTVIDASVLARLAAELKPTSRSRLDAISAADLEARTAYKAAGLTAGQIRDRIKAEWERQQIVRAERRARKPADRPAPGRILELAARKAWNLERTAADLMRCQPLLRAQTLKAMALVRIDQHVFRAHEEVRWDHDRYSKSWHRNHGPAKDVLGRAVEMLRTNLVGELEVAFAVQVKAFRGNWLIQAVIELLGLEKVQVPRELRPVQLGDYYTIQPVPSPAGVQLYARALAGEVVDYCAVDAGETYHAESTDAAIEGLRGKLEARARAAEAKAARNAEVLTVATGRRLGFCRAGMQAFCDANGVDIERSYTRGELRQIVAHRRRENLELWGRELERAGLV